MARRKRKDDAPDWVAPEFDEVGYMRREMEGARASVATIIWAIVGALVAFALYSVLPVLAFFAGIAVGFGLYFMLPLFGVNTEPFKRRDWVGHGVTYFFSWLAFWIILLNPPFGDFTDPTIQGVSVSQYPGFNNTFTCAVPSSGSVSLSMGSNTSVYILFRATDNLGLASLLVRVTPQGLPYSDATPTLVSGNNKCAGHPTEQYPAGMYNATFTVAGTTTFDVLIVATDPSGRQAAAAFRVFTPP